MTLADSHVKTLLKEGTARVGSPPSGSDWRMAPDAVTRAKELAEEHLRKIGADAARRCADAKRSTLKAEDFQEEAAPSEGMGSAGAGMMG